MFHDVRNIKNEKFEERYKINGLLNINDFENKILYLKQCYKIISINDYLTKKYSDDDYSKLCILTFDDGLYDHYNNVYPILKKYNITGIFFISAFPILEKKMCDVHKIQFIIYSGYNKEDILKYFLDLLNLTDNKKHTLWEDYSKSNYKNNTWSAIEIFLTNVLRNPNYNKYINELFNKYVLLPNDNTEEQFCNNFYLNENHIREMYSGGMEFGIHGYYHNLNDNEETINKTKIYLENIGIKNSKYYSYPNGIIKKDIIEKLDIKLAFTTENRNCIKSDNILTLPRINCSNINSCKYKIVLCGIQKQGLEICKFLIDNNINISYIVTITEEESIKNKASGWVDYSKFCNTFNIPIYYCKKYKLNSDEDLNFFNENCFHLLLLGGWQRLIPENILKTLTYGGIGQHGSSELLPKCRGRSPLNWSIILNRKRLIWNIFFMTPGIDDGNIIDSKKVDINEWDNCRTLYYKISIIVKQMYLENIPKILNNQVKCIKQIGEPSFYKKRTPEDGMIDWSKSFYEIYNLIRAVTHPYPGAFTYNGLEKIFIWDAQPFDTNICYPYSRNGEIVEIFDNNFVVNCSDGLLLITNHDAKKIYKKDILTSKII